MYKALTSFTTGTMSVMQGQILDLTDADLISDLTAAGYIEEYTAESESDVDLSDYVKYTDYAQANHGGDITSGYGFNVNSSNGKMSLATLTASAYESQNDSYPISKGTLENVLAERLS